MAQLRLSCPNWKEGHVIPVTVEVPVKARR
jgi:hypothetical protein